MMERKPTPGLWARIRLAWRLVAFIAATIVLYLGMRLDRLLHRRTPRIEFVNKWVPRWAGCFLWLFGIQLQKQGPHFSERKPYPGQGEQGRGRVFVANHRSSVDVPVMLHLCAGHAISRHDLANWPLFGSLGKDIGTLYVDRGSRRSGAEVLGQVDESLKQGEGVIMFPEGTSYLGDEVHPFRPGAFKAAERANAEIVPVAIAYEDDNAHYYHEKFTAHLMRIGTRRRLQVAVVAGEPVVPDQRDAAEVRDAVQSQLQAMVHEAREILKSEMPKSPRSSHQVAEVKPVGASQ